MAEACLATNCQNAGSSATWFSTSENVGAAGAAAAGGATGSGAGGGGASGAAVSGRRPTNGGRRAIRPWTAWAEGRPLPDRVA